MKCQVPELKCAGPGAYGKKRTCWAKCHLKSVAAWERKKGTHGLAVHEIPKLDLPSTGVVMCILAGHGKYLAVRAEVDGIRDSIRYGQGRQEMAPRQIPEQNART